MDQPTQELQLGRRPNGARASAKVARALVVATAITPMTSRAAGNGARALLGIEKADAPWRSLKCSGL